MPLLNSDILETGVVNRPESRVAYIILGTLKSSVLITADLKSVSALTGHFREFSSDEPTVLVQGAIREGQSARAQGAI
jgi:hypothetical protein